MPLDRSASTGTVDRANVECPDEGRPTRSTVTKLRYVITDEIKKAATGLETDVLDALNIDWRAGRPHIQCPYPDHTDNDPSWRWDERRARAICTCTTNGHADGIFDVVAKVEGIEFDVAKIRVAELLHRNDLNSHQEHGSHRPEAGCTQSAECKGAAPGWLPTDHVPRASSRDC